MTYLIREYAQRFASIHNLPRFYFGIGKSHKPTRKPKLAKEYACPTAQKACG
ncbi:MAG TPA: hypothetical protein VJ909_02630 [Prolixibacteraceae bacterium]|nr:hypothetical protein [Prolixibacteraceae bacterium]